MSDTHRAPHGPAHPTGPASLADPVVRVVRVIDVRQVRVVQETTTVLPGLTATGRTRDGLPEFRATGAGRDGTIPVDFAGTVVVGGPQPEFWVWLALTLVAVPVALVARHVAGVPALVVVIAGYVAANLAAMRAMPR